MLSGEFNKTVLTSDLNKTKGAMRRLRPWLQTEIGSIKSFPLSVEMVSVSWKPSCPCPTQSEIHPRELMVCSLEMGTFWDKNSLVSGTVNFCHPQAKITKDDSKISQGVWLWGRAAGKQRRVGNFNAVGARLVITRLYMWDWRIRILSTAEDLNKFKTVTNVWVEHNALSPH